MSLETIYLQREILCTSFKLEFLKAKGIQLGFHFAFFPLEPIDQSLCLPDFKLQTSELSKPVNPELSLQLGDSLSYSSQFQESAVNSLFALNKILEFKLQILENLLLQNSVLFAHLNHPSTRLSKFGKLACLEQLIENLLQSKIVPKRPHGVLLMAKQNILNKSPAGSEQQRHVLVDLSYFLGNNNKLVFRLDIIKILVHISEDVLLESFGVLY